ncbi:MAG: hypothetical protein Q8S18_00095 [Bacteroidales bacterium]|nr:hypothetical protein [Bacteroidales bacterium]
MKTNEVIERFGGLSKAESLSCIENEILFPNTCALEAKIPFMGYYGEVEANTRPLYVYLSLDGQPSVEEITRATINVRKKLGQQLDAVAGNLKTHDQSNPIIRLRGMNDYHQIAQIQEMYLSEGLTFKKRIRKFDQEVAFIHLNKFFYLTEVAEGQYVDDRQPHHGYFAIPRQIRWEEFNELSKEVKFDTSLLYFDATTAFIYVNDGIVDLVRIYKENLTADLLAKICSRYLKLLKVK